MAGFLFVLTSCASEYVIWRCGSNSLKAQKETIGKLHGQTNLSDRIRREQFLHRLKFSLERKLTIESSVCRTVQYHVRVTSSSLAWAFEKIRRLGLLPGLVQRRARDGFQDRQCRCFSEEVVARFMLFFFGRARWSADEHSVFGRLYQKKCFANRLNFS
jgi:hypothetical protein